MPPPVLIEAASGFSSEGQSMSFVSRGVAQSESRATVAAISSGNVFLAAILTNFDVSAMQILDGVPRALCFCFPGGGRSQFLQVIVTKSLPYCRVTRRTRRFIEHPAMSVITI